MGAWLVLKAGGALALGSAYEISDGLGILHWSGIRVLECLLLLVFALPLVKMLEGGRLEACNRCRMRLVSWPPLLLSWWHRHMCRSATACRGWRRWG